VNVAMSGDTSGDKVTAGERDVLGRLADRGEEALHRLAELPGGSKALKAFNDLRTGVDDLGKRVRGLEALEARVAKLEKEVARMKRAPKPPANKQASPPNPPA
jgi:hypothetical protein